MLVPSDMLGNNTGADFFFCVEPVSELSFIFPMYEQNKVFISIPDF